MKIIAANHKANHTPRSVREYLSNLDSALAKFSPKHEIIVFPNTASLTDNVYSRFNIGAQNAYPVRNGAFTGEIGLETLESLRINHILLGHSERRFLGESDDFIKRKFDFFSSARMRITLCIGEDSNVKDVRAHLASQLSGIDLDYALLSVAYEPIWAIGSGRTPTLEDISAIMRALKEFGVKRALYGGSVNLDNIYDICLITDGALIGGAALDCDVFINMIGRVLDLD